MIVEPSRPEGPLIISDVRDDSVHLSWKPPLEDNGGPIQGYVIEAKDVLHMDVRKTCFWSDGQATDFIVRGLETSHIYQFRVYAQNEAGRSEGLLNKSLVRIKVKSKKPPKPSKPLAEAKGDDSVFLEWSIPDGYEGLNYVIERSEPKNDLWLPCNRELVILTTYLVVGLASEREYRFRVSSENAHGVSVPSEESNVISLRVLQGETPLITLTLKDCYAKYNDSVSFICEYSGTPPIQVDWVKDNIRVRAGLGSTITSNDRRSELELSEVDSDDDDCVIQCTLRNEFGHISSNAKIKLLSSPEIRCPSSYKEGLTYDAGDSLRLRVTFSGKPLPKLTVYFNDEEVSTDGRTEFVIQPESMEIRIQDLCGEDSGVYKFIAQNELGNDSLSVGVNILGPPHPPDEYLAFECTNENQIILSWNLPVYNGGSDIYNYVVEKKQSEDNPWFRLGTTHKTLLIIGGLDEVNDCWYRVRAENIYGTSEPSKEKQFTKDGSSFAESITSPQIASDAIEQKIEIKHDPDDTRYETTTLESLKSSEITISKLQSELEKMPSPRQNSNCNLLRADVKDLDVHSTNVVYAATQTLLSPLILNFACNCSEMFCETFLFSTEAPPQTERLMITYEKCNILIPGCSIVIFETMDHIPESIDLTANCTIQWIPEIHFIVVHQPEIYLPFLYSRDVSSSSIPLSLTITSNLDLDSLVSEERLVIEKQLQFSEDPKEINCIWYYLNIVEQLPINFKLSQSDFNYCKFVYEEISVLYWLVHPLILEDSTLSLIRTRLTETCSLVVDCYEAITVSKYYLFEIAAEFILVNNSNERTALVTEFDDEYDELISICSVPVTTYKPAMSVLPFNRESKPSKSRGKVNSDCTFDDISTIPCKKDAEDFIYEGLNIPKDELIIKSSVSYQVDVFKNPLKELNNLFEAELEHLDVEEMTWKCPDWLKHVSPLYIPETKSAPKELCESLLDFETVEIEMNTPEDKLHTKDVQEFNLKEKSVEELLQLAEEVERSFTQKAEQIESLENILHDELFSLEKDLEVVNEIHKNLNDSHSILDSNAPDHDEVYLWDLNSKIEQEVQDLIELNEDIPSVQHGVSEPTKYAPEVIVHLQNRVIQSGCRTRLYCSITGDPEPQIEWFKNGNVLPSSSRYICSNLAEFGIYLDIFNTKSTDSGQFTCLATNCCGSAQTQAYLQIIGKREISPVEPTFVTSPDDISVCKGELVILEWKISGTPSPHVIWFKNAEKIVTTLRITTFSNHRGLCRLILHDVNISDSAIYSCYVENEAGSSVSTVLLAVSDENGFSSQVTHPKIPMLGTEEILSKETSNKYPEDRPDQNTELKEPIFSKHIRTKKGLVSLPGPPFAAHILSAGQTWVTLTWSPPLINGEKGLEYLVERRLLKSTHWKEVGRTRSTLYTAYGFKGEQSYVFRISAGNSRGWGLPVTLQQPVHFAPK